MILWASDSYAEVLFDNIPRVGIRYMLPSCSAEDKKSIKKYPFINKMALAVELVDLRKNKRYNFVVPKGYCYDGASIPRIFWRIIGSNTDNSFLIAALIHDVLCEHHEYVDNDRKFSTQVFNLLLKSSEVPALKRFFMKNSVDIFQKLFCGWHSNKKKGDKI